MQADSFRFGVWDADYPSQSTGGFLRPWVHQSRKLLSVWPEYVATKEIAVGFNPDFTVKWFWIPSGRVVQLHPLHCCDTLVYLVRKLPGQWGCLFSTFSLRKKENNSCVGPLPWWSGCMGVTWVCDVCTGGWLLILFRVMGGIIWRLQRPYSFSSCVLDPGLSALWKNLNHSPKLDCSPVWLWQRHRRCHCLLITVHRWPSLLMDL